MRVRRYRNRRRVIAPTHTNRDLAKTSFNTLLIQQLRKALLLPAEGGEIKKVILSPL